MNYVYGMHFLVWSFSWLLQKKKKNETKHNLHLYQQLIPTSHTDAAFYHLSLYVFIWYVLNGPL